MGTFVDVGLVAQSLQMSKRKMMQREKIIIRKFIGVIDPGNISFLP